MAFLSINSTFLKLANQNARSTTETVNKIKKKYNQVLFGQAVLQKLLIEMTWTYVAIFNSMTVLGKYEPGFFENSMSLSVEHDIFSIILILRDKII